MVLFIIYATTPLPPPQFAGADPGFEKGGHGSKKTKIRKLKIFMARLINARSSFCVE